MSYSDDESISSDMDEREFEIMDEFSEEYSDYLKKAVKDELLTRLKKTAWDRKYLMSFRNGTLNLKENNFTPKHNRYDYLTHGFNFNYDPVAKCPLWLNFLNETFENDQQVKQILRAAFRWTVSPKDISKPFLLELFFDLYGEKGCGKGTIQEVLTAVCGGDKARGIIRSTNIGNPTSRAALLGKKLAIDPDASGRMTDAGIFNSIVSNEPVEIKVLYINESFKRLGIVVWRNFNDQPSASGGGVEGMGRRMVTFRIKNRPTEPDPELKDKLLMEVSGIFQWCWSMSQEDMLETFKRRGEVKAISEASIENQLENQPVLRFLIDSFPDGDKAIKGSTLYESYKTWCNDEGCGVLSNAKFGKEAKKVKGLVLWEHTRYGSEYEIGPAKGFDLAGHFGIKNNVGLNPSQNQHRHINPSPQKTREVVVSQEVVKGMKGLSPIFNFEKEKDSTNRKKETGSTRQTHHSGQAPLKTVTEQVNEAWDKGHRTEDSIFKNSSGLTRNEVKRTLKRQGRI